MKYTITWRDRQYRIDWAQVAADVTGFLVLVGAFYLVMNALFPSL